MSLATVSATAASKPLEAEKSPKSFLPLLIGDKSTLVYKEKRKKLKCSTIQKDTNEL